MNEFVMHPLWNQALGQLKRSVYAEQVFCSVVTEMSSLEPFQSDWFGQIHKLCFETSFYRNDACGHMIRLHYTSPTDEKVARDVAQMVVKCLYQVKHLDKQAGNLMEQQNSENLDEEAQRWADLSTVWHQERRNWLRQSARTVRILLPENIWIAGKEGARSNHENI